MQSLRASRKASVAISCLLATTDFKICLFKDCVPIHSNANSYSISSSWHPDTEDTHLLMVKNVMYLQPTTGDHGALRVIPGSHRNPLHKDLLRMGMDSAFRKNTKQSPKEMEFHQHFNTGGERARYLAVLLGRLSAGNWEGGRPDQIEYEDQNPAVYDGYAEECEKAGVNMVLPRPKYQ